MCGQPNDNPHMKNREGYQALNGSPSVEECDSQLNVMPHNAKKHPRTMVYLIEPTITATASTKSPTPTTTTASNIITAANTISNHKTTTTTTNGLLPLSYNINKQ